jgi:Domain of unknown function (DUF4373)
MARPLKTGLDYFPLDCDLCEKVYALDAKFGNDGFAAWVKLLQAIYKTDDGCFRFSDVFRRTTAAKRANLSEEQWNNIVEYMLEVGLFDREAFDSEGVLTSNGIKKRIDGVSGERAAARKRALSRPSPSPTPPPKRRSEKSRREESRVEETPHFSAKNEEGKSPIVDGCLYFRMSEKEKTLAQNKYREFGYDLNLLPLAVIEVDEWLKGEGREAKKARRFKNHSRQLYAAWAIENALKRQKTLAPQRNGHHPNKPLTAREHFMQMDLGVKEEDPNIIDVTPKGEPQ